MLSVEQRTTWAIDAHLILQEALPFAEGRPEVLRRIDEADRLILALASDLFMEESDAVS